MTVSPLAGPDRTPIVLRGFSDCAVIDGHLLFTSYDGKADNVVVRSTSKTYDYDREKYPYTIRLTVPANAAPGSAKVYAEPFCGPPEEYPASVVKPFRVERSSLLLRLSRRSLDQGDRLRVRAATCDGSRGRLTVRFLEGGVRRDEFAVVDAAGAAAVSMRVRAGGTVSLPLAASECPGSAYVGGKSYVVRTGGAAVSAEPTPSVTSSTGVASVAASPSTVVSASTSPSASAAPDAADGSGDGVGWLAGVGALLLAGVAGGLAVVVSRRRAT